MKNRLKPFVTKTGTKNKVIEKTYGESKAIKYYCGYALIPISYIKTKPPMQFKIQTCDYTEEGRELVHDTNTCNKPGYNRKVNEGKCYR